MRYQGKFLPMVRSYFATIRMRPAMDSCVAKSLKFFTMHFPIAFVQQIATSLNGALASIDDVISSTLLRVISMRIFFKYPSCASHV